MPFDIFNSSGAKIAENVSDWTLEKYYNQGLIKDNDKVVETEYLKKNRKEKMPYYHTTTVKETAVMRDINNVKKRRD